MTEEESGNGGLKEIETENLRRSTASSVPVQVPILGEWRTAIFNIQYSMD